MTHDKATTRPVTGSGWYENDDGSVTRYDWRNGWLCAGVTVSGWAAVPSSLDAAAVRS